MTQTTTVETDERLLAIIPKNSREEIRVVRKTFEGHDLLDARVWALSAVPETDPKPTKKGLCCKPETWRGVAAAVLAEIGPGEGSETRA